MSDIEEPNISLSREKVMKQNLTAVIDYTKETRKLTRKQDKKIEDLEKLIQQQNLDYIQLREEFNNFRQRTTGTGATE
jgi:molecular chaperone GrpE (heat shock protein)